MWCVCVCCFFLNIEKQKKKILFNKKKQEKFLFTKNMYSTLKHKKEQVQLKKVLNKINQQKWQAFTKCHGCQATVQAKTTTKKQK